MLARCPSLIVLRTTKVAIEASHAALVLDGAGYHIAAALTIPENVTLVRLPPYAPELNPIENVWEYLLRHSSRSRAAIDPTIEF